jgi:hypothetical protein
MDLRSTFINLVDASKDTLDVAGLRGTRTVLVSLEFASLLESIAARSHNDPQERRMLISFLLRLRFAFRDQAENRTEQHKHMHVLALSGGSALAIGAMLAAATQSLSSLPFVVPPLVVGIYAVWRGSRRAIRLALESSALDDIIGLLDGHIRALQSGDLSR